MGKSTAEDLYKEIIKHKGKVINNGNFQSDTTVYESLGVVVKVLKHESPELDNSLALAKAESKWNSAHFIIAKVNGKHIIIQKMADHVLSDLLENDTTNDQKFLDNNIPNRHELFKQYFELQADMINRGVCVVDPKPHNFGLFNGRLYLIDVGSVVELKDMEDSQKRIAIAGSSFIYSKQESFLMVGKNSVN